MSKDLLEKSKTARKSPATLKISLSKLRSRFQDHPILILEGIDDVGPYETWANRVINSNSIKMLPGSGKEQLLALRARLKEDETGLRTGVFFAVDHDFDGLKEHPPGPDIYCTDRYSIENYFIDTQVMASVLRDEFRLAEDSQEFEVAMKAYSDALRDLTEKLAIVNFRIYACRRLGIKFQSVIPEIQKLVQIRISKIELAFAPDALENLLPITSPIPLADVDHLRGDFERLDVNRRNRGKFLCQFFLIWTERLADEARAPSGNIFDKPHKINFSSTSLSLRSLASRSEIPFGFREFVIDMVNS